VAIVREELDRLGIQLEPGEHLLMPDAATRIAIHLGDEVGDRGATVAHHVRRRAPGRRNQHAIDDEEPMVVAGDETLDDDRARDFLRQRKGRRDLLVGGEVDRDRASMIAVVGLDHDGKTDALGGAHRIFDALDQLLTRHRESEGTEELVGFLLVAGHLDGDMRGAAGDGGLDALLILAEAELHQRIRIEAHPRDVARFGGVHQRGRARPEGAALGKTDVGIALAGKVPIGGPRAVGATGIRQQREQQAQREFAGLQPLVPLFVLVDHVVHALGTGAARLAEGHLDPGDVLQLDRHMLEHVPQPGPLILGESADEATGFAVAAAVLVQTGEGSQQRLDELGTEAGGRPRFEGAEIEPQADDREMGVA
jgi:hypothetical protein